jgi:alkylation response protein AidB-like acyl-CoA dehydrogenase
MDMRLTDEQKLLQSTFARFFAQRCPLDRVRELEAGDGYDPAIWAELADLGALGLLVPEQHGGLGGSFVDAVLLCEAIGSALYPSPFVWTCVVAPALLGQLGDAATQAAWLPKIAAGQAIFALVDDRASVPSAPPIAAARGAGGYLLRGAAGFAEFAAHAHALLVMAQLDGEPALFALPPGHPGLLIEPRSEISGGQFFRVSFDDVPARKGERLEGDVVGALSAALDRAMVALAARMVGSAQRLFDITLRYMREREQFGQPLLRFQALNFRMAEMLTRIDAARLLAYRAAWLIDQGQTFAQAALVAKIQASEVYRAVASESIQLHGGFGFTADASPQLFYRRAASDAMLLGTATALRERLAHLLL